MAGGEVIPNGSVHWSIDVDELDAQQRPQAKKAQWTGNARASSGATLDSRGAYLYGVDRIPRANHPTLRVTLRARNQGVLRAALEAALNAIVTDQGTGLGRTIVELPAEDAGAAAEDPPPNPRAQVRIDWGEV